MSEAIDVARFQFMPQTTKDRTMTLLDATVTYAVSESTTATRPRIDVGIGGITVVLPDDSGIDPEAMLREHARWVLDKRETFARHRAELPDRTFAHGETFPYLGEDHTLVIEPRRKSVVEGDTIRLRRSAVDQSSVERALRNFYRREAREHLSRRLDRFSTEMALEYERIEIRNQRTRWGSCSSTGTISLNYRLLLAPPAVIDYVVVHELAHLREPNHSDSFWSVVARYMADYETHARWLEENAIRLVFTEEDL